MWRNVFNAFDAESGLKQLKTGHLEGNEESLCSAMGHKELTKKKLALFHLMGVDIIFNSALETSKIRQVQ